MIESLTVANETFDPFLSDLGDVQKVFGNGPQVTLTCE
jgi:hypothetical protein